MRMLRRNIAGDGALFVAKRPFAAGEEKT